MVQGEVVGLSTSLPWSLLPCGTAPAGSLPCVPMGKSVGGSLVPASPLFFKGISGAKRKEKEKERKQVLIDHPDCFLMFLGRAKINNNLRMGQLPGQPMPALNCVMGRFPYKYCEKGAFAAKEKRQIKKKKKKPSTSHRHKTETLDFIVRSRQEQTQNQRVSWSFFYQKVMSSE